VYSPYINQALKSIINRWAAHVVRMGRRRSAYILFVERPVRNRTLGRPMLRWVDNIKMNLQAVAWGGRY